MKLWEVLKELEENPKKRFTSKFGSMSAEIFMDDFSVNFMHEDTLELSLDVSRDWQEVKQPVPWKEAIEAFLKGKKVRCHINCNDFYYEKDKYESNPIKDNTGYHLTASELMHGEWYIED